MTFYVYALRCSDGSYYIDHSDDLEPRLAEHHAGIASSWTARRLPVTLVHIEEAPTRLEALERERQSKGWSRAKKEALFKQNWNRLGWLSRPH